jgi:hypothetical protein
VMPSLEKDLLKALIQEKEMTHWIWDPQNAAYRTYRKDCYGTLSQEVHLKEEMVSKNISSLRGF